MIITNQTNYLGNVDDGDKVTLTFDHLQRLPVGKVAGDVDILAAALPLEDRGHPMLKAGREIHLTRRNLHKKGKHTGLECTITIARGKDIYLEANHRILATVVVGVLVA